MKQQFSMLMAALLLLGLSACNSAKEIDTPNDVSGPHSVEGNIIPGQYIVEIKASAITPARTLLDWSSITSREDKAQKMEVLNAKVGEELDNWMAERGISQDIVIAKYTSAMVGFAAKLNTEQFNKLSKDATVAQVEFDRMETLPPFEVESIDNSSNKTTAQTTPCGITNAGGYGQGSSSYWIWIVDTGIDTDHPDLNVYSSSPYANYFVGTSVEDCNGHGTHVAGTAAARNNTIGVVGMSQGATVVPVRVFNCSGGSPTSTIISGINHVSNYDISGDVMNLSLGGYYGANCATNSSYKTSVTNVANGGTRVAIASGNNMANAANYQPACLNGTNIYTVTNMRCNKTYYNDATYGGNYGRPPVDYIATGTSVYSTYLNGGYATLTGTSMATPHVAGIMHVRQAAPATNGNVTYSGVNYPIAVK